MLSEKKQSTEKDDIKGGGKRLKEDRRMPLEC